MMHRRALLVILGGGLMATQRAAAQPPAKVPRVGAISSGSAGTQLSRDGQAAFEAGLRALGWVPGSTIAIEYRHAEGDPDRLARLVAELVRSGADVIVARTGQAQRAVAAATTTIPIVLAGVSDPVAMGLVKSLPRPGGNATGLSLQLYELYAKQLEMLKQAVPKLQRVGVLLGSSRLRKETNAIATREIDGAARLLRLEIQYAAVGSAAALPEAFSAMSRSRAGAVMVIPDGGGSLDADVEQLVALPAKHRLPTMYTWRHFAEAGGLMAYAVDLIDIHRQSARFVDKILKGTKPADIPVEQPSKFEFVINLKTARALGLAIPQPLLQRADRLIE